MALYTKLLFFFLALTVTLANIEKHSPSKQSTVPLIRKPRYYFAVQDYLKPWNLTLESLVGRWKPVDRRTEKPKVKLQIKPQPKLQITTPKPQLLVTSQKSNCTESTKSLYNRLVRSSLAVVKYLQKNIFVEMFLLSQGPEPHARWNSTFRRLAGKLESWSPKSNCTQQLPKSSN